MQIYSIDGVTPVIDETSYIHPTAVIIGDVIIGSNCYIGPNASIRGDFGQIILEQGSNLQDTCVIHGFPASITVVESNGHIGHGAVLHGCNIGKNSLVGMNAVVMDGATIGAESIIGAGAFVKAGFKCEPRSMVVGSPAKVIRTVSDQEIKWKTTGTEEYQHLAVRCLQTMKKVEPLREIEENRPTLQFVNQHKPKG